MASLKKQKETDLWNCCAVLLRIPAMGITHSEMIAITIPTGYRSLFGGSRHADRHRSESAVVLC